MAVKVARPQTLRQRALRNGGDEWIKTVLNVGKDSPIPCWRHNRTDAESWADQLRKALQMNHDLALPARKDEEGGPAEVGRDPPPAPPGVAHSGAPQMTLQLPGAQCVESPDAVRPDGARDRRRQRPGAA